MFAYIHDLPDWPTFHWDHRRVEAVLGETRHRQGRLLGLAAALGVGARDEATARATALDALKTSEIEGELLAPEQVRSSVARRLGLDTAGLPAPDARADGVVAMLLDATRHADQPLTADRLFGWHIALFPTGRSGLRRLQVGAWRLDTRGPMQVVSGGPGRETVHFEAMAAARVPVEMAQLLTWLNAPTPELDPVVKAGLAHLWFVTVHPFEDGNGRIGRAIADWQLARADGANERFYALSAQIQQERGEYYRLLSQAQRGGLDATTWLLWFLECLQRALAATEGTLTAVRYKAHFWRSPGTQGLNQRQHLLLNRLLDGFEGKLTSSKWAKIAKCSQDTATRDIQALIRAGLLVQEVGGGRSTSYRLVPDAGV